MPSILLITAPTVAQPRLRLETLEEYKKKGYVVSKRVDSACWEDLFDEGMTPSLFEPQRIFEIDDGKSLGRIPDVFKKYIEKGDSDVIFLILTDKSIQKELGGVYKDVTHVPYEPAPHWPSHRTTWLQKIARGKGYTLDSSAAALLVEWIEDEEELRSEIDKLAKASSNGCITADLVNDLSIDEGGKGMLNLLDASAKADVVEVLKNIALLKDEGELIPIISALHKRVRNACMVGLLGDGAAKALHLTPFQTKTAKSMAQLYGNKLLSLWLGELIRLSWAERAGEGEGWEGLEKLILAIISRAKK